MNQMNDTTQKEPFCPVKWFAGKVVGRLSGWIGRQQIGLSPAEYATFAAQLGAPGLEEATTADAPAQPPPRN